MPTSQGVEVILHGVGITVLFKLIHVIHLLVKFRVLNGEYMMSDETRSKVKLL